MFEPKVGLRYKHKQTGLCSFNKHTSLSVCYVQLVRYIESVHMSCYSHCTVTVVLHNYHSLRLSYHKFHMKHALLLFYKKTSKPSLQHMRLDSNIESKSSNNTYLNTIKLLFLI